MSKQRVFLTGATGGMGFASLKEMLKDTDKQDIVILARDSEENREITKTHHRRIYHPTTETRHADHEVQPEQDK